MLPVIEKERYAYHTRRDVYYARDASYRYPTTGTSSVCNKKLVGRVPSDKISWK